MRITALALAAIGLGAAAAHAQQPNADARAFGMGGNFTAAARNYDAVAWNPANLALPGNSVAAFSVGALGATGGTAPVTLKMLGDWNGQTIPTATKEEWLALIGDGRERGRVDAGFSAFAMSIRNVAFQVGMSGTGDASLNRDAAEVLLYGNAGRTGSPGTYSFAGSEASGAVFTTGAASIGFPLPVTLTSAPDEILTLGITAKYVRGNAMARAVDAGSAVTPSGVSLAFPMVHGTGSGLSEIATADLGHGVGVDVGLAWHARRVTLGLTVQNLANGFTWDTTRLVARLGTATVTSTSTSSSFSDTAYALAPAALRATIADERFTPTIAGGVALRAADWLLLTADARVQTGDGNEIGPRSRVGAGLEFSGIGFLPIRVGGAVIPDGWQGAAGFGLNLGQNHVAVSAMVRERDGGRATGAMINLVSFY